MATVNVDPKLATALASVRPEDLDSLIALLKPAAPVATAPAPAAPEKPGRTRKTAPAAPAPVATAPAKPVTAPLAAPNGIGPVTAASKATMAEITRLRAENEKLRMARVNTPITMKISGKKALSIYGLGRFPVTLYREQWEKLATSMSAIQVFIGQHASELAVKASK